MEARSECVGEASLPLPLPESPFTSPLATDSLALRFFPPRHLRGLLLQVGGSHPRGDATARSARHAAVAQLQHTHPQRPTRAQHLGAEPSPATRAEPRTAGAREGPPPPSPGGDCPWFHQLRSRAVGRSEVRETLLSPAHVGYPRDGQGVLHRPPVLDGAHASEPQDRTRSTGHQAARGDWSRSRRLVRPWIFRLG